MVERVIRTMKHECTRRILVPLNPEAMREELTLFVDWYNQHRPHQGLGGRVPMDVFLGIQRLVPWFETRGSDAVPLRLVVRYHGGRKHLPVVELEEAARRVRPGLINASLTLLKGLVRLHYVIPGLRTARPLHVQSSCPSSSWMQSFCISFVSEFFIIIVFTKVLVRYSSLQDPRPQLRCI